MPNNNDKQERPKQQVQTGSPKSTDNDPDNSPKEQQNKDTDTAPDQFIGPNADTDLPIDGQVVNDAVLRGEPHPEERSSNWPTEDSNTENEPSPTKKMDAGKK